MNEMMSKYTDLTDFLQKHNGKNDKNNNITHTRIGDPELNIYGGAYSINPEELSIFHKLYYEHIFIKNKKEYLTEKQIENGPIVVDLDFRYDYQVDRRQHTLEHIHDIVQLYLSELKEFFIFDEESKIPVYVMEKPHVNRVENKNITKDGIHIIFGVQMNHTMQIMLRENIVNKIGDICDLPLTNDWGNVLDEGISKGTTNWQLYGSQKPGNEAYALTHYLMAEYTEDGDFLVIKEDIDRFDLKKNFNKLSIQYTEHAIFEMNPSIISEYNTKLSEKPKKMKSSASSSNIKDDENNEITGPEELQKAMDNVLKSLNSSEYFIKEIHEYTQILAPKYYEAGSHLLNRQVAFALKNTDNRLFLSWVMLRSKASDFDYSTIPKLFQDWNRYFNTRQDGITKKSIIYWAKQDSYEEYKKVKQSTVDSAIEDTLRGTNEFDLAMVLFHMFKDKYVCASIVSKQWYIFKNHRWEEDKGLSLRLAISKDMFNAYQNKLQQYAAQLPQYEESDEIAKDIQTKIKKIASVSILLKKTNDKNNIIKEAMELFYDNEFTKNMDANKYLMCFTNGVVDFKAKCFRDGYPQDYITKTTNIPYVVYDDHKHKSTSDQIKTFMEQLFPVPALNKYMWEHLSSCLIGTNMNQTFNIYCGSGSNGKSLLTDLMSQTLGEYKGTVPITLVTEKRGSIGGTSSEVMQLKGIRYAVMQEPSKETRINEGVMKELTGGDPIQGRALYCDSEIFEPQFKLVVCTNSLFEFGSNDDGTWRRIRKCDFMSKFVDEDETYTDDTQYIFPKDKGLKEKLPVWAPIFASMLVNMAYQLEGNVKDSDIVLESSNKYRQGQDYISTFVNEMIVTEMGAKEGQQNISQAFTKWFQDMNGRRKMPKVTEVFDYIDKKFGKRKDKKWWLNIKIVSLEEEEDDFINK
jgi:P4 family phage/plasmid primase-like protien